MTDRVNQNFVAIQAALNTIYKDMNKLGDRLGIMEKNLAALQGEIANQKQLTAHVLGRGMGATKKLDS